MTIKIPKFNVKFYITISLFLILVSNLSPKYREFFIDQISIESGLSNKTVTAIIQDNDGYMWFGTESGLNRYDGYNFKIFENDPDDSDSISYSRISSLIISRSGSLWIGTNGGGINKYIKEKGVFKSYLPCPDNDESLANTILSVCEDRDGKLWIGTWGEGLFMFDTESGKFKQYKPIPGESQSFGNRVRCIYEIRNGDLLIGTGDGLYKFNKKKRSFSEFFGIKNRGLNTRIIVSVLTKDKDGVLWVGTHNGIFPLDLKNGSIIGQKFAWTKTLNDTRIYSIVEDKYGRLWIGSWDGLIKVDPGREIVKKYSEKGSPGLNLSSGMVLRVYIDISNTIWVGTMNGLNMFNGNRSGFKNYDMRDILPGKMNSLYFTSIFEDHKGLLWLSTIKNGVISFDRRTGEAEIYMVDKYSNSISSNVVLDVNESRSGKLLISTSNGLNVFDRNTRKFIHFLNDPDDPQSVCNNYIVTTLELSGGEYLVGTMKGLNLFNLESGKFKKFIHDPADLKSIGGDLVTSLTKDSKGRVWVGIYGGGLNRYYPDTKTFERIEESADRNLRRKYIYPVFEAMDGTLWMGSNEGGLKMFDPDNKKFRNYFISDGLTSNTVWDVLEDKKGKIWFSTSEGISRLNRENDSIQIFNKFDGLLIDFFSFNSGIRVRTGELFFAGNNGFVSFDPDEIEKVTAVSPIILTSIKKIVDDGLSNIPVTENKKYKFKYRDKLLIFNFSVLSFLNSNKNRYKYQLSGLSEEWVDLGPENSISFGNLSPGEYELKVTGANCFGVWNKTGTSVAFRIHPAFWQTWWFQLILFLLLLAGLIFFHRSRLIKLEKKLRNETDMDKLFGRKGISKREKEIVLLIIQGRTSREIEDILFISYGTVKNHIYSIYKKLNVKNRAEIVNLFKDIKSF